MMGLQTLARRVMNLGNRIGHLHGQPFDPATPIPPPGGRLRNWVHYGVMVPNLPEPHRTFGVMSILGTPGVTVFANDHAITTTPADTVYTVSATASMDSEQFFVRSIARDCEFRPDGSHLRFGTELVIDGVYPHFTLRRSNPDVAVELEIDATDKVAHFANIPGLYRHWSLLAQYHGHIDYRGHRDEIKGLCTFEYAAGSSGLKLPGKFFTYQLLNLDDTTQVLFGQVLGPAGFRIHEAVYIRSLDDHGSVHTRGIEFSVSEYEPEPRLTPDGRRMRLPRTLQWRVLDDDGQDVIAIKGTSDGDYTYGLGAGYVGSYEYTGTYRGRDITGRAYMEYIDCR